MPHRSPRPTSTPSSKPPPRSGTRCAASASSSPEAPASSAAGWSKASSTPTARWPRRARHRPHPRPRAAFLRKLPHLAYATRTDAARRRRPQLRLPCRRPCRSSSTPRPKPAPNISPRTPTKCCSTILDGTAPRAPALRQSAGTRKLLFTSSGAVYGPQPPDLSHIPEDYPGAPNPPANIYGEGKRAARTDAAQPPAHPDSKSRSPAASPSSARTCRSTPTSPPATSSPMRSPAAPSASPATAPPSAPTSTPPTSPSGSGPCSSARPSMRAYNVGSEDAVTIRELAETTVRAVHPACPPKSSSRPIVTHPPQRYVPSTSRARTELNLRQTVTLEDALRRTARMAPAKIKGRSPH